MIRRGSAEAVDEYFPPNSFDLVFCRLMMNYVMIENTLRKIHTLLRRGGVLWLRVRLFGAAFRLVGQSLKERRLRSVLSGGFAVFNSISCMTVGAQLRIRSKGRMHDEHKPCYPTLEWWRKALRRTGYDKFRIDEAGRAPTFWVRKTV